MKPNEIIVGERYQHNECPGTIFLGIGNRKMFQNNFTNQCQMLSKHLVVIEGPCPDFIGLIQKEGDDALTGWWDGFTPIKAIGQEFS